MAIHKISSLKTTASASAEVLLAGGQAMAMRMWRDEPPQDKAPHRSPYETIGYVVAGRAELTIQGETTLLEPGDSWLVPANVVHNYKILEIFTSVECTSPPAFLRD